jgi:hypothetical protein
MVPPAHGEVMVVTAAHASDEPSTPASPTIRRMAIWNGLATNRGIMDAANADVFIKLE